jgi:hypothetical protein
MNIQRYQALTGNRELTTLYGTIQLAADASVVQTLNTGGLFTAAKAATGRYRVTFRVHIPNPNAVLPVSARATPMPFAQLCSADTATLAGAFWAIPGLFDNTTNPRAPTLDILTIGTTGALADVTKIAFINFALSFQNSAGP